MTRPGRHRGAGTPGGAEGFMRLGACAVGIATIETGTFPDEDARRERRRTKFFTIVNCFTDAGRISRHALITAQDKPHCVPKCSRPHGITSFGFKGPNPVHSPKGNVMTPKSIACLIAGAIFLAACTDTGTYPITRQAVKPGDPVQSMTTPSMPR
jgi:hypothetical protein